MDTAWLDQVYFENSIAAYLRFAGIILAAIIFKHYVSFQLSELFYKIIKNYSGEVDSKSLKNLLKKPVGILVILICIYFACKQLHFPASWHLQSEDKVGFRFIIWKLFVFSILVSVTWTILRVVDFFALVLIDRARKTESKVDDQIVPFIKESIKFLIVILSFFFVLGAIFKVNIASLIAGLGIGGIAIALAAKDTLENLFGSFAIFIDKPFTIGDLVKTGNVFGRVERIGFRSTEIRTLEKTIITLPNKKLIDAELENLSRRTMIRAMFPVVMRHETSTVAIEEFSKNAIQLITTHSDICKDPAPYIRLDKLTEYGIELQVFFFVNTTDADYYQIVKEELILKILGLVRQAEIRLDTRIMDNTIVVNK
jgi:MscS family membrane protein